MSEDIRYDDEPCRRFNESLDAEGEVIIAGAPFYRSQILFELDIELYKLALDEFLEQEYEELKQIVFDSFPACIAYNFRLSEKGEGSADPVRKLLHLKDTWETISYVLYALVMGEVRCKTRDLRTAQVFVSLDPGGNPQYVNFNTDRILSEAVKQKIQNIKSLIQHSKSVGLGFKFEEIDETLLDDLLAMQDIRNDVSHHQAPSHEQAQSELIQLNPLFQRMLTKTRFLENCKILRFESFGSTCRCEVYNGHSLNREFEEFQFEEATRDYVFGLGQEQLFVQWDDECFSLSPFLHFDRDPEGHESRLCYYKRRRESKFWYEPVKTRTDICFDNLQSRFDGEKDSVVSLLVPR